MDRSMYSMIEKYMISCMEDSAHDKEHVYRVLYNALDIAKVEKHVDYDVLITACLLHDIGRKEQLDNSKLCHAIVGGEKAFSFLLKNGFEVGFAENVKKCIQTHRFRSDNQPQSIEAKILFDADKLDVAGAIGIARTLVYRGSVSEPLYNISSDGEISNGEGDTEPSFFKEYKYKLEKIYSTFYTARGMEMAKERQNAAVSFYNNLYMEVSTPREKGKMVLNRLLN